MARLAQEARDAGNDELADSLTRRDIQQQFNDLMLKAQTIIVDIAAGPIGKFADIMGNLLANTTVLKGVLIGLAAVKLVGLISSVISLGTAMGATTVASSFGMGVLTFGIGLAVAGVAAAIFLRQMKTEQKKVKVTSYADLGAEEMVTLDRGSAIFDAGESVVHTKDLKNIGTENRLERTEQVLQAVGREMHELRKDMDRYFGLTGTVPNKIGSAVARNITTAVK